MKPDAFRDLRKLRWQLLALAILLALAVTMILWSHSVEERSRRELDAASAQFRQTESKLRQVRTEEQEIKEKSALFLGLMRSGILGEERRLDWTEMLRDIQRQLRLPRMSYEFAPQAPLENGVSGDYTFYTSPMKIHLQLVHENDLINFLDLVQRHAKALVLVRSCSVGRTSAQGSDAANSPLSADCALDWITVHGASSTSTNPQ